MAKIIKISAGEVTIAQNNGELIVVPDHAMDFIPKVNDLVEVYKTDHDYIINKATSNQHVTTIHTGKKPVNKIAYGLLAIFFGGLGVHKFYAGKIGLGILYILFCWTWIPSIVALIEAIIGFTKEEVEPGIILV